MEGEGDEAWVSTSPIKLAAPQARRTFTPGRALSREEIRQQRRRGLGEVDHPIRSQGSPRGILHTLPTRTISATVKTQERLTVESTTTQTTRALHEEERDSSSDKSTSVDKVIFDNSITRQAPGHGRSNASTKEAPSKSEASTSSSSSTDEQEDAERLPGGRSLSTKQAQPTHPLSPKYDTSPEFEEGGSRVITQLFNPSPSFSASPPAAKITLQTTKTVIATRLTFDQINEAEEQGIELQLTSSSPRKRLKADAAATQNDNPLQTSLNTIDKSKAATAGLTRQRDLKHVNEITQGKQKAQKETTRAPELSASRHASTTQSPTSSQNKKRPRDADADDEQPAVKKTQSSDAVRKDRPSKLETSTKVRVDKPSQKDKPLVGDSRQPHLASKPPPPAKRRELKDWQDFVDWTWPAVQQCLKDFRKGTSKHGVSTGTLKGIEANLEESSKAIFAKIQKLQSVQAKRRKESEKLSKIQDERRSLAMKMHEEERLWQQSRREFRLKVGLHEAAIHAEMQSSSQTQKGSSGSKQVRIEGIARTFVS